MPTEIPALREIEKAFSKDWLGFANVIVRHPTNVRFAREIDLILVTHDRVIMVDLKHWAGRLENVEGYWHQNGERREGSPVEKMRGNVNLLLKVFETESFAAGGPRIEGLVVLTHPNCDTSRLGEDGRVVMRIGDFLRLAEPKRYQAMFSPRTSHTNDPLNVGSNKGLVRKFFSPGRIFEPRKTRFSTYEAVGSEEFTTSLYSEYLARDIENENSTALLRVWDFTKDEDLRHSPERKDLVERKRAVLGYLRDRDPDLATVTFGSRARDPEVGPRCWELFDRDRHSQRLSRFINDGGVDLELGAKFDLAKMLSGHVAALHRADVAHRDLGGHSIWIDRTRRRIALSSFGAARFPDRKSTGALRTKLLGAGLILPEDAGVVDGASAYHQDVFLLGAAVWAIVGDCALPVTQGVPDWALLPQDALTALPPSFARWLGRCLNWDPEARFSNGIVAHDALLESLALAEGRGAMELTQYEDEVDPILDFPPTRMIERTRCRIYTTDYQGETLLVKNWPERLLGNRNKNVARLLQFFGRAERLRSVGSGVLPRVRRASLCADGLFVLQDFLAGDQLEKTDIGTWSAESFRRFVLLLIDGISEAHELGVPHGDISPRNVLVDDTSGDAEPRIVDFLDYTPELAGDRVTLAYVPLICGDDPYARDRFAIATIACEIAAKVRDLSGIELAAISNAVDACSGTEAPWATLRPLVDVLGRKSDEVAIEPLVLLIGFPSCQHDGSILADDGMIHVVLSPHSDEINLIGFDAQVILRIDRGARSVSSVRQIMARPQTHAWAANNKAFSLQSKISLYYSARISFEGLETLFARAEVAAWLDAGPIREPPKLPLTLTLPVSKASTARPVSLPIAKFWEEQILAEENVRPSLALAEDVFHDSLHDVMIATHDSDAALQGVVDRDTVFFDGVRIGFVADAHSSPGNLAFRFSNNQRHLKAGDVLTIQPRQSAESLRRRALAVRRILRGRVPIKDLVSYFDPASRASPSEVASPVEVDDISIYGLNLDQTEAFRHLWLNGPVGLLQGPPGTGKTKFIAAFIHYALTKGQCRNILLVSQSHEAVNTAAERIQDLMGATNQDLDLLRIANNPEKISDPLRCFHVEAIQDLYLDRFEAEAKDRICMIAKRLGLPREFAEDIFEMNAGPVKVARQIAMLREMDVVGDNIVAVENRIASLEGALSLQLDRFDIVAETQTASVIEA